MFFSTMQDTIEQLLKVVDINYYMYWKLAALSTAIRVDQKWALLGQFQK